MPFTMTFTADTPAELFAQIAAVAAFGEAPPTKTTASTKPAAKATKTEPTKETKVEAPEEKPDAAEVPSATSRSMLPLPASMACQPAL